MQKCYITIELGVADVKMLYFTVTRWNQGYDSKDKLLTNKN